MKLWSSSMRSSWWLFFLLFACLYFCGLFDQLKC
uniref:Uncharacterized protein n=1 Tax=Tetranychus urticae TaxID=32264 RepID=T1K332_TETUR